MPDVHAILLIPAEGFWSRVKKGEGCWEWQGGTSDRGYGRIKVNGKMRRAHRVAWALTHGRDPTKMVLHTCDNPSCVRPDHLYEGNHAENMRDRAVRGRLDQRGTKNPAQHLFPEEVLAIRADPRTQADIASSYGISQSHVSQIKRRTIWGHLDGPPSVSCAKPPRRGLDADTVSEIIEFRNRGWTYRELSTQFGVSKSHVGRICRGESWKWE